MVEILETGSIADGFSCWDLLDSSSDSRHYHCDGRDGDDSHSKGGDDDGDIMIMIMVSLWALVYPSSDSRWHHCDDSDGDGDHCDIAVGDV